MHMETITLTFGDCAENHRGMQAIGEKKTEGLQHHELMLAKLNFEDKGVECVLVDLRDYLPEEEKTKAESAYILIARKGCQVFASPDDLMKEQTALMWDEKAFMYGRVVQKKARHNLCYSDFDQEAEYEKGKGTVVAFDRLPNLKRMRQQLPEFFGDKAFRLQCEGNRYYDVKKTYIGFHGDTERRMVIAARLGSDFPIHFQWFQDSKPIGTLYSEVLKHGDVYVMSEKAVGCDWKRKKIFTLRHAAGKKEKVVTW